MSSSSPAVSPSLVSPSQYQFVSINERDGLRYGLIDACSGLRLLAAYALDSIDEEPASCGLAALLESVAANLERLSGIVDSALVASDFAEKDALLERLAAENEARKAHEAALLREIGEKDLMIRECTRLILERCPDLRNQLSGEEQSG